MNLQERAKLKITNSRKQEGKEHGFFLLFRYWLFLLFSLPQLLIIPKKHWIKRTFFQNIPFKALEKMDLFQNMPKKD